MGLCRVGSAANAQRSAGPERWSSSGSPLGSFGRLVQGVKEPEDVVRVAHEREDAHPTLAPRALERIDAQGAQQLRTRSVAAALTLRLRLARVIDSRDRRLRDDAWAKRAGTREHPGVTDGAKRQRSESGSRSIAIVPSAKGRLRAMRTKPSGPWVTRSWAMGRRSTYSRRASRDLASSPPARVAAWSVKPSRLAQSGLSNCNGLPASSPSGAALRRSSGPAGGDFPQAADAQSARVVRRRPVVRRRARARRGERARGAGGFPGRVERGGLVASTKRSDAEARRVARGVGGAVAQAAAGGARGRRSAWSILAMTAGSVSTARTVSFPPQRTQTRRSVSKVRFRRVHQSRRELEA